MVEVCLKLKLSADFGRKKGPVHIVESDKNISEPQSFYRDPGSRPWLILFRFLGRNKYYIQNQLKILYFLPET
jgi:hypothetical protein